MNDYYTRYDIAKLSGRGYRAIMLMDQAGLIPGLIQIDSGVRNLKFIYDKKLVDEWLKTLAPKSDGSHRRCTKKKKTVSTITFRDVFAGKFLPKDERLENFSRLIVAQASRPVTQRVSFKGVY
jgi:hypothetical protein